MLQLLTVLGYAAKPGLLKRPQCVSLIVLPGISVPVGLFYVLSHVVEGRKEGRKEGTNDDL